MTETELRKKQKLRGLKFSKRKNTLIEAAVSQGRGLSEPQVPSPVFARSATGLPGLPQAKKRALSHAIGPIGRNAHWMKTGLSMDSNFWDGIVLNWFISTNTSPSFYGNETGLKSSNHEAPKWLLTQCRFVWECSKITQICLQKKPSRRNPAFRSKTIVWNVGFFVSQYDPNS